MHADRPVCFSRNCAALRVGVVTDSARPNVRRAAFQAKPDRPVLPCLRQQRELEHVLGHEVVGADDADAPLLGLEESPRPVMMWDWKCTTSGFTWSMTRALFCLMRHGNAKRSQSCGNQRQLYSRCAVISWPSWISFHVPCLRLAAGAMTCTSWPRSTSPAASRSANRAAPFTLGAKVSAPIRMRSGRSVSESPALAGVLAPGVSDTWRCSSQFLGAGRSVPSSTAARGWALAGFIRR